MNFTGSLVEEDKSEGTGSHYTMQRRTLEGANIVFNASYEISTACSIFYDALVVNNEAELSRPAAKEENNDLVFYVRDRVSGIAYDTRNPHSVELLNNQQFVQLPKNKAREAWDDLWQNKRKRHGELLNAIEKGDLKQVKELLDKKKNDDIISDLNMKSLDDFTVLHTAVSEGHAEIVRHLLSLEAPVDALTTSLRTPLHVACNRGNLPVIKLLVEAKANVNAQDANGNTAAHILSSAGYGEALRWLLTRQPDLGVKNACGETAVETAMSVEIRRMLENCVGVSKEGKYARTVMEGMVIHNNRADVIKSFMFKAQLMRGMRPEDAVKRCIKAPKEAPKARIIKILEVVEKLKSIYPHPNPKLKRESMSAEDFEVCGLLGKGSFGEIYLVRYRRNGKLYAMKTLSKHRIEHENLIRYARTERNILMISRHPFIVGLNFAFQNSEKLFMIMKYCPG